MKTISAFLFSLFLLASTGSDSPLMAGGSPRSRIEAHLASIQNILNRDDLSDRRDDRKKLELMVLNQIFDFREMARSSLGSHAKKYANRLDEFTPLFVSLLEHKYLGEVEDYGRSAKISYTKELIKEHYAEVETRVALNGGGEYRVNYKLQELSGDWKIYDVVVEGISMVNNYRNQFNRYLTKKSFDDLLQNLRDKKDSFN